MSTLAVTRYTEEMVPSGDFQKVQNINAVLDSLANLLSIRRGTYPFDPEVGTDLPKYIFDLNDEITYDLIKTEIENTFASEPNATITGIEISSITNNKGLLINVYMQINNIPIQATLTYNNNQATVQTWTQTDE